MLVLIDYGFSLQDVELLYDKYDVRVVNYILDKTVKEIQVKEIKHKLDMAEAFHFAYFGSQPKQKGKASPSKALRRWRIGQASMLKKLRGEKVYNAWDKRKRMKKSIKF
jgi:hypothetical protein